MCIVCCICSSLVNQRRYLRSMKTQVLQQCRFSQVFNLGIGLGSFIGGQTINLLNIQSIGYIAGIIAILSIIFYIRRR